MATDTSAPLPDLKLQSLSTFTVTLSDPNAKIASLVIHGDQVAGDDITQMTMEQVYLSPSQPPEIDQANFGGPAG
jgi:hypothetical protein